VTILCPQNYVFVENTHRTTTTIEHGITTITQSNENNHNDNKNNNSITQQQQQQQCRVRATNKDISNNSNS